MKYIRGVLPSLQERPEKFVELVSFSLNFLNHDRGNKQKSLKIGFSALSDLKADFRL